MENNKRTVIIGATNNPDRYAFEAASRLQQNGYEFVPVGIKTGEVFGQEIQDLRQKPVIADVDTVTLYMNPQRQAEWEDYILSLNPRRIIFNPGTENPSLFEKATQNGIEALHACTLVMLGIGTY